MYITSFLYNRGLQCPKLFVYAATHPTTGFGDPQLRHYAHEYVRPYNKVKEESEEVAFQKTKELIETTTDNIVDGIFLANNCYVRVASIKQTEEGLILYIPKGNTKLKKEYKQEAAFVNYVVKKCGFQIKSIFVMTINSKYIRYGNVDPRLLFTYHDCTMDAFDGYEEVEENVEKFNALLELDSIEQELSANCLQGNKCPNFVNCFSNLTTPSVFDIGGLSKNICLDYYLKGIISYQDLLDHEVALTPKQMIQITSYLNQEKPTINERRVSYFLSQLHYPLYFLDFESFQVPVPRYEGCHPYQAIPFQYSLHYIEEKNGELKHKEFLGVEDEDPRYELAKHLCEDIPENACIIAYNNSLEKSVIMDSAILFEEFRDHLLQIYPNVIDLQIPFANGDYYDYRMNGSYSIKSVLPALCPDDPTLDYSNLEGVHQGAEAMMSFIHLGSLEKEAKEAMRESLLQYCNLDTLAMVKIWEKLEKELTNNG